MPKEVGCVGKLPWKRLRRCAPLNQLVFRVILGKLLGKLVPSRLQLYERMPPRDTMLPWFRHLLPTREERTVRALRAFESDGGWGMCKQNKHHTQTTMHDQSDMVDGLNILNERRANGPPRGWLTPSWSTLLQLHPTSSLVVQRFCFLGYLGLLYIFFYGGVSRCRQCPPGWGPPGSSPCHLPPVSCQPCPLQLMSTFDVNDTGRLVLMF